MSEVKGFAIDGLLEGETSSARNVQTERESETVIETLSAKDCYRETGKQLEGEKVIGS